MCIRDREESVPAALLFEILHPLGFNSNRFDIPVLAEEFLRAGVDIDMMKRKFIDVQVIYHKPSFNIFPLHLPIGNSCTLRVLFFERNLPVYCFVSRFYPYLYR